ncbi:hypothetical protein [Alkaliphilus sp. B6464]|uniref:hypothetical protein n=1 Tax=Alkaliphilus sp. B6464 TaxID=2731219 RepID=UPI001BAE30DD|nr:hypothetical protein [Alkaliphilus sp. B6464]QUH22092.1 hypothetical protein HYG84_19490 [Alkaliphilus sp. B6464]
MKDLMVNFEDHKICVILGDCVADIEVNGKKIKTTYNKDIEYIELSKKLNKLVKSESEKTTNLQNLFAFGDSFRMSVVDILKGRA